LGTVQPRPLHQARAHPPPELGGPVDPGDPRPLQARRSAAAEGSGLASGLPFVPPDVPPYSLGCRETAGTFL